MFVSVPLGLTPKDLAMDCDFYDCADLIDDLEKLRIKQAEDVLRVERLNRMSCVSVCVCMCLCVSCVLIGSVLWC